MALEAAIELAICSSQAARQWVVDNCPYQYYFRSVDFQFDEGVLTLHGKVPTFFLKQVLQSVLGDLPEIERIENQLEMVSSVGLSSVRPR